MTDSAQPEGAKRHPFDPPFIVPTDRVVVVLGAGASISEMAAQKADSLPPTDANFLQRAEQCAPQLYLDMQEKFDLLWRGNEPRPLKYQRMEMLFSSAYLRVTQTKGTTKEGRAARDLYDALVILLRETLSRTTAKANPEQHLELFRRVAAQSPQDTAILSFNYDVLADRALLKGARSDDWSWTHADGYGFQPENQPCPKKPSRVKLLKLHGSMNWYIPTPGRTRAVAYRADAKVYVPNPPTQHSSPAWKNKQQTLGHSKTSVFPLLVPPVFEKGAQIIGALQSVWDQAAEALRRATVVIVWGYSLPMTDYHAEVLFAQTARKAKYRLFVLNPDRAALAHVTDVCGHAWNRWYFKAEHFLREQSATWNDTN